MFQLMALKHTIIWQMDVERSQNIPIWKTVVHVIMAEVQFACAKVTRVQLCCGRNTWFDYQLDLSVFVSIIIRRDYMHVVVDFKFEHIHHENMSVQCIPP